MTTPALFSMSPLKARRETVVFEANSDFFSAVTTTSWIVLSPAAAVAASAHAGACERMARLSPIAALASVIARRSCVIAFPPDEPSPTAPVLPAPRFLIEIKLSWEKSQ